MSEKKRLREPLSAGELMKIGETFMGNSAKAKLEENVEPEFKNDNYRANIRIYPDFKVTKRTMKSCPVLAVYNATEADIDVFIHSLVSAIISLRNAKSRLRKANGIKEKDREQEEL